MNLITPRRAAAAIALSIPVLLLVAPSAGSAPGAQPTEAALWCQTIPYVFVGDTQVYPGGQVCVPGP